MSTKQVTFEMKNNIIYLAENRSKQTPIAKVAPELKQREQNENMILEISKACAVLGCEESKNLDSDSFFRFPEDPNLRQIWTELTGRINWTSTDFSYICALHFSDDVFVFGQDNKMHLTNKAIPSMKLPGHVLEVEYIDEDTLENDMSYTNNNDSLQTENYSDGHIANTNEKIKNINRSDGFVTNKTHTETNVKLLKLFSEVQTLQRQAVGLKHKLKCNTKIFNQQKKTLQRLRDGIELNEKVLKQKSKNKSSLTFAIRDKIKQDSNGLILAMPTRYTKDLKNFALSIYKYSPQAYIYVRNALRTTLPSTDILDDWINSDFKPKNIMSSTSVVKVVSEQTDSDLTFKICLH